MITIVKTATRFFVLVPLLLFPITGSAQESRSQGDIVLGMSTALSGPAEDLGKNMKQGVLAGLERVNRAGGVNNRKLKLIALDDGYEPTRTAPNMRRLIQKEKVLAIIGNVGTPTAIAAIPIAHEQKTLLFAAFTGAGVLRKTPPDRYVINYRASYAEETAAMIDALMDTVGMKPQDIAFFTQRDGYGDAGYVGGISALKHHGLKDENAIVHARYERNTLAVENALADVLFASTAPKAVIMVGAYAPCAKFIKLAKEVGLNALFLNVSFVGSAPLARELGEKMDKVIVTQVVPHPEEKNLPIVKDYHEDLQAFDPKTVPTFGSLEGYIAARIFLTALKKIKGLPNRESVIDALDGLNSFDIGLGEPLHLSTKRHQASHRVWPTVLKNGKFVTFEWKDIGRIMKSGK